MSRLRSGSVSEFYPMSNGRMTGEGVDRVWCKVHS